MCCAACSDEVVNFKLANESYESVYVHAYLHVISVISSVIVHQIDHECMRLLDITGSVDLTLRDLLG